MLMVLIVVLIACCIKSTKSKRSTAPSLRLLMIALMPPLVGNLVIIISGNELASFIGCYFFFIGLDLTVSAALVFTSTYCSISFKKTWWYRLITIVMVIDIVQLLLNPVFHHAFSLELIFVEGFPYYVPIPYAGLFFHRAFAYSVFFVSLAILTFKTFTAPRIDTERYAIILASMIVVGALETFFIVSRTPVDRSMIAFGLFGVLAYFFALQYRPLRLLDRMLGHIVADMPEAVFFFDRNNDCIFINDAARSLLGVGEGGDINTCKDMLRSITNNPDLSFCDEWERDCITDDGDKKQYWNLSSHVLIDKKGKRAGAFTVMRDTTEEEERLAHERHLASHDPLTGLYTEQHLYKLAREMINDNPDTTYLAVALDIKDFKIINDIFSKEYGDEVLRTTADLIRDHERGDALSARLSSDRFGMVVPKGIYDVDKVAEELRKISVNSETHTANYSIIIHAGVYEISNPDMPFSVMFDRAFMALGTIKNDYERRVAFYNSEIREETLWQQKISTQLDEALATGQIQPFLQPMVNENGEVRGAEMLARWVHPEEGLLPPGRFIPVLEKNGMIARVDCYIWECACQLLKKWQGQGIDQFLSVNISPKDFYFLDVSNVICDLVKRYEIDPSKLRLEITETVMMSDVEARLQIIENLRAHGFLVEMDDFGSGYSSLNMLKDIPVDVLKIDMMFLYKTKDQLKANTILQTIIDLSGRLGIPSITEGVETIEQRDMLVKMGCKLFQGYYFAKPMPVPEFEAQYLAA